MTIAKQSEFLESAEIGERVKALRADKSIAQNELAQRANIDPAGLSRAENGKRAFPVSELLMIANELDVSTDELLLRDPEPATMFRNEGGADAAREAVGEMEAIMDDFLSFRSVAGT
jgi:transcriptional regulator with XRE-family HTH domain